MSQHGVWQRVKRVTESMGGKLTHHGNSNQARWQFPCSHKDGCHEVYSCKHQKGFSPDMVQKEMRRKGWEVDYGSLPLCPLHSGTHRTKRIETGANISTVIDGGTDMSVKNDVAYPSGKIIRKVISDLEEFFDAATGRYKADCSDALIAKNAGTTERFVAQVRNEAFGVLKEDPEIAKLRDDLIMFQLNMEETQKRMVAEASQLLQRLERIAAKAKEH